MSKKFLYVSSWRAHGGAPGLTLATLDDETGELELISHEDMGISFNCSFVSPDHDILYVNNEDVNVPGIPYKTGQIYGYSIDKETGHLTELFEKPTMCPNPSYISLDKTGKYIVGSMYGDMTTSTVIEETPDGTYAPTIVTTPSLVELIEVKEDGTLGEILDVKKHDADTHHTHPYKQKGGCHAHSAVISPSGKLFAVCDKGEGCVYMYTIDYENRKLKLLSKTQTDTFVNVSRYCAFHPTKPYFFVNHEGSVEGTMHVSSFHYDEDGNLELIDVKDALPEGHGVPTDRKYEQQGFCISPDGGYLYTELNGPEMVAVFKVHEDGSIERIQNVPINGTWPRGMFLTPNGRILVTGCLVSGDVASYSVGDDGLLTPTGHSINVPGAAYFSMY